MVTPVTVVREGRGHSSALSSQSLELPGQWDKFTPKTNEGSFLLPVGTHWVENDVLGVAEEVSRVTRGKCRVASCPCGHCVERGHFPHVVLELDKFGRTHPVFGSRSLGPHIVQRLREMHVSNEPNKKSMSQNAKERARRRRLAEERQAERLEVVSSALASHKFDWRGPNGIRTKAY